MWNHHLPSIRPYYAVKCNADPVLLRWLHTRGAAFDCASSREMTLVSGLYDGRSFGKNVLFANPCKTPQDISVAKELNVPWVTVDSVEELEKMDKANYRPELVIRLTVDDSGSTSPFAVKFGAPAKTVKEIALAAEYYTMPIVGLSFHVGSGSDRPEAFRDAIIHSTDTWKNLKYSERMKVLDIGGGWSSEERLFKEQSAAARSALTSYSPLSVIAEPGRFFAAPVYSLYVRVIGKKPLDSGWRYTLDESIYGQFSCVPFDHAKPAIGCLDTNNGKATKAILFGRTCDSLDWIANSLSMQELNVGDWLYIPTMGAYTSATSTEFNGFPKPDVIETDIEPDKISWLDVRYPLSSMLSIKDANL